MQAIRFLLTGLVCALAAPVVGGSAPAPTSQAVQNQPSPATPPIAPPTGAALSAVPPATFDSGQFAPLTTETLPLEKGEPVIMRVNGRAVSWDDFTIQTRLAGASIIAQHPGQEPHIMAALAQPVSDALVLQELYRESASKNNLAPQPVEIDRRQAEMKASTNPALKQAIALLHDSQVRRVVIDSLIHEKVDKYNGDLATSAPPTMEEIANFVSTTKPTTAPMEVTRARHIVIRATADMSEFKLNDAKARAEEVLARVRGGLNFAAAARQYSQDRFTAYQGGNLGYYVAGAMYQEFEAAASQLAIGETSGLVRTPVGYHIIQVTERHSDNLRMQLDRYRRQMAVEKWKQEAAQGAKVERFLKN